MKNFWKWILGIVVILVVLFGLGIGARLLMGNFFPAGSDELYAFRSPMMGVRNFHHFGGMMGFGGGSMLFGGLVPLALLGALVYGAFWFGKRKSLTHPIPGMPVETAPVRTCTKCGQQVQDGWNNCANCGTKI